MCPWVTWQSKDKTAFLQKGVTTSGCHLGACNLVNFTTLDPEDHKSKNGQQIAIYIYIYGQGKDPGTILYFKRITVSIKPCATRFFTPSMKKWKELCPISPLLPEICL
jgi:hypothetical protein